MNRIVLKCSALVFFVHFLPSSCSQPGRSSLEILRNYTVEGRIQNDENKIHFCNVFKSLPLVFQTIILLKAKLAGPESSEKNDLLEALRVSRGSPFIKTRKLELRNAGLSETVSLFAFSQKRGSLCFKKIDEETLTLSLKIDGFNIKQETLTLTKTTMVRLCCNPSSKNRKLSLAQITSPANLTIPPSSEFYSDFETMSAFSSTQNIVVLGLFGPFSENEVYKRFHLFLINRNEKNLFISNFLIKADETIEKMTVTDDEILSIGAFAKNGLKDCYITHAKNALPPDDAQIENFINQSIDHPLSCEIEENIFTNVCELRST